VRLAIASGFGNSGFDSFPQDLSLKLGNNGEHAGNRAA